MSVQNRFAEQANNQDVTISAFWENDAFGGAYLSAPLDKQSLAAIKSLVEGQKMVLKTFTKNGKTTTFLKAIPLRKNTIKSEKPKQTVRAESDDEI